jgi:processive 1,2-diacylglycerol beta-glucosyltransferase
MPKLYFVEDEKLISEISEEQLEFLIENLEEEDSGDRDYFIDKDTLEMLEDAGCDEDLLRHLRHALGDKEEMDIRWAD